MQGQAARRGPAEALAAYAANLEEGRFREAADLLEAAWQRRRGDLAKALIKVAVAFYQQSRGRRRGAVKLLAGALALLDGDGPEAFDGPREGGWPVPPPAELARLRRAVATCLAAFSDGRAAPREALAEVACLARAWAG